MSDKQSIETSKDLLKVLVDLFNEIEPKTSDEVDAVLREAGYEPNEVAKRMNSVARQAMRDSPLNWRNRAPAELAEASARLKRMIPSLPNTREDIIQFLKQSLANLEARGALQHAHFRNFESLTDEDLRSLIAEIEYLASESERNDEDAKVSDEHI
jgi:DNA-directed RNA polymerase subunit F